MLLINRYIKNSIKGKGVFVISLNLKIMKSIENNLSLLNVKAF